MSNFTVCIRWVPKTAMNDGWSGMRSKASANTGMRSQESANTSTRSTKV